MSKQLACQLVMFFFTLSRYPCGLLEAKMPPPVRENILSIKKYKFSRIVAKTYLKLVKKLKYFKSKVIPISCQFKQNYSCFDENGKLENVINVASITKIIFYSHRLKIRYVSHAFQRKVYINKM